MILRGKFHVVPGFPLHFMLYRGNLDCFSNSVEGVLGHLAVTLTSGATVCICSVMHYRKVNLENIKQ